MPRIIQDSDDEGDFGSLSPVSERAVSPASGNLFRKGTSAREEKSAPGTSSTEGLRRDIAAAHQDVVDGASRPNEYYSSHDASDLLKSLTMLRKRKVSDLSFEKSQSPPKKLERRKNVKTYGSSNHRQYDLFDESTSAFEALEEQPQEANNSTIQLPSGSLDEQRQDNRAPIDGKHSADTEPTWGMQRAFADDFAQHEPTMFPDPSSTIPDATMTQRRLVEAALAEKSSGEYNEATTACQQMPRPSDNLSIPWSDYLQSSESAPQSGTTGSGQHFDLSLGPPNKPSIDSSAYLGISDGAATADLQSMEQEKGLQRIKSADNARQSQSSRDESADELSLPHTAPPKSQKRKISSSEPQTSSIQGTDGIAKSKRRRSQVVTEDSDDEEDAAPASARVHNENQPYLTKTQQTFEDSVQESICAVRSLRTAKAHEDVSSHALNSDEIAIGLPKEKYKPRPSRSRSTRLTLEESIDYSIRPERAIKDRSKRRKTTDVATIGRLKLSLAEKVEKLVEMGFSPTKSREALSYHNNDLESAMQSLLSLIERTHEQKEIKSPAHNPDADADVARTPAKLLRVEIHSPTSKNKNEKQHIDPPQPTRRRGRPPKNKPSEDVGIMVTAQEPKVSSHVVNLRSHNVIDELQGDDITQHEATNAELAPWGRQKEVMHQEHAEESKSKRRLSPVVQPTPTSLSQAEVDEEIAAVKRQPEQPQDELKPKRRGHGRPRSVVNVNEQAAQSHVNQEPEEAPPSASQHAGQLQEAIESTTVEDFQTNTTEERSGSGKEEPPDDVLSGMAVAKPAGSTCSVTPDLSNRAQTPEKSTGTGTAAQHSLLAKGKVSYRVGLSKKARITPLLRIVKKQ